MRIFSCLCNYHHTNELLWCFHGWFQFGENKCFCFCRCVHYLLLKLLKGLRRFCFENDMKSIRMIKFAMWHKHCQMEKDVYISQYKSQKEICFRFCEFIRVRTGDLSMRNPCISSLYKIRLITQNRWIDSFVL